MKFSIWLILCLAPLAFAFGADEDNAIHHESEAGTTMVSGNTTTETYNVKQATSYKWQENTAALKARYLNARANGVENAKNWDGSLRYEREIDSSLSLFAAHILDSDVFAGFIQRNSYEAGVKYIFFKNEETKWFGEGGYRYIFTRNVAASSDTVNHATRLYSEVEHKFNDSLTGKLWAEYIPSFSNGNDYLANAEPSISVLLSKVFSLKTSYLFKYRNLLPANVNTRLDTLFTTALVAKF